MEDLDEDVILAPSNRVSSEPMSIDNKATYDFNPWSMFSVALGIWRVHAMEHSICKLVHESVGSVGSVGTVGFQIEIISNPRALVHR